MKAVFQVPKDAAQENKSLPKSSPRKLLRSAMFSTILAARLKPLRVRAAPLRGLLAGHKVQCLLHTLLPKKRNLLSS
jgi:hypothetical protein